MPAPASTLPSAPASVSGAGFSGLLSTLQVEWDALMVETYNLKASLEETRRELSQALYQNDAAVRVIARLTLERDQARSMLAQAQANPPPPATTASSSMDVEATANGAAGAAGATTTESAIPQAAIDKMKVTWNKLCEERKGRKGKSTEGQVSARYIIRAVRGAFSVPFRFVSYRSFPFLSFPFLSFHFF